MLIGRVLGVILLACAGLVAGADVLRFFEMPAFSPLSLGELWALVSPEGPQTLEREIVGGSFPGLWADVIGPLLALPGTVMLLVLGGLLLYMNRKRYLG